MTNKNGEKHIFSKYVQQIKYMKDVEYNRLQVAYRFLSSPTPKEGDRFSMGSQSFMHKPVSAEVIK